MSEFKMGRGGAGLGMRGVVSDSSISAFGFPFQHRLSEPLYLPLDEAHPLLPQDVYGLSKASGEEIAAAYTRRTGESAASLRISTIVDDTTIHRLLENARDHVGNWASSFWSYVHASDVAQACLLPLTRPFQGHPLSHITSNDTLSELPTDELLDLWFPTVPRLPTPQATP